MIVLSLCGNDFFLVRLIRKKKEEKRTRIDYIYALNFFT